MSQTLFVFSSVFIPIVLVVSFFIWLNSLIEDEIPSSKKKCVKCGKKAVSYTHLTLPTNREV